jgi:hypothetical protein
MSGGEQLPAQVKPVRQKMQAKNFRIQLKNITRQEKAHSRLVEINFRALLTRSHFFTNPYVKKKLPL